jgi:phage gp46-like protein
MDIALVMDPTQLRGDWQMAGSDLLSGADLETAVLVSLFTDAWAGADFTPPDGSADLRGWWADTYTGDPIGSRLWTLERATKTQATLNLAIQYANEALAWLVTDGLAASVAVFAEWQGDEGAFLAMSITITEPSGQVTVFQYGSVWSEIN